MHTFVHGGMCKQQIDIVTFPSIYQEKRDFSVSNAWEREAIFINNNIKFNEKYALL